MTGTVVQVSTSRGGLPKYAVFEGHVSAEGIEGDGHNNPQIHGGPRQALLIVTIEGINELRAEGFDLYPGALGENLTVEGIDRRQFRIGQRFRIGETIVEITKLRSPCTNLNVYNSNGSSIQKAVYDSQVKAGDPGSPRWALGGVYCSVSRGGTIRPEDPITLLDQAV